MTTKEKVTVPTVILQEVKEQGIQIVNYSKIPQDHFVKSPHRDNDYLFVFIRSGFLKLLVDFQEILITTSQIYYILPGQIHQHLDSDDDVWVIATDAFLIQEIYKTALDESCFSQLPVKVSDTAAVKLHDFLQTFSKTEFGDQRNIYQHHIKKGLIDALIGMFTVEFLKYLPMLHRKESRAGMLTIEFKKLLFNGYKRYKSPSEYAEMLKVSTSYLNESIKLISGQTVSFWIKHMVLMEAKRLLYYTDNPIKHIAHELGYLDQAYFTRLFTKSLNTSPQAFRNDSRR